MLRPATLAAVVALAKACPPWWSNPCTVTSGEYASPQFGRTCGQGYVSTRGGSHMGITSGPFGWPGGRPDWWDQGYYSQGVYLQSCAASCANSPTCIAYSMMGSSWVYSSRLGTCHLYNKCDWSMVQYGGGNSNELWWMGNSATGISRSDCQPPTKDFKTGCDAGQEKRGGNCQTCNSGTFKPNYGAEACQTCRSCPSGEYKSGGCSTTTDSECTSHSGVCANSEFQVQVANAVQDRACQQCAVCQPGQQVLRGCARADPWSQTEYSSDEDGKAKDMLALYQQPKIDGRAIVVHNAQGAKIGCGVLNKDPWASTQWQSDMNGRASGTVSAFQEQEISGKVIVVHASDMTKIGCGKITLDPWANTVYSADAGGSSSGSVSVQQDTNVVGRTIVVHSHTGEKVGCGRITMKTAQGGMASKIKKFPGYGGNAPSGEFSIKQTGKDLQVEWSLSGLAGSTAGTFHIHAGSSCNDVQGHLENTDMLSVKIERFPGYNGNIAINGGFQFEQSGSFTSGSYKLTGMEQGKRGGYHIHSGTSCTSVGGHFENGLVHSATIKGLNGNSIKGSFGFYQANNAVRGQYSMYGLLGSTSGSYHMHTGTSCENVGSHLTNDDNFVHIHQRRLAEADHPGQSVTQLEDQNVAYNDANAKCAPCVVGETFSTKRDQAVCMPVKRCTVGEFTRRKAEANMDTLCDRCDVKPAHSYFTSAGSGLGMNDCKFDCLEGWELTNNGKNCALKKQGIVFDRDNTDMGIFSYDDNTIKIKGKCLDAITCNGKEEGATITQHLQQVFDAFCPLKLDPTNQKYSPKGFYVLDDGVCRYDCIGGCAGATPFDQTSVFSEL